KPVGIDLRGIYNKILITIPGYSFMSNPINKLVDIYLELFLKGSILPIDGLLMKRTSDHGA
ncbi:hypothetical protein BGZ63DRAFT_368166, partial [Mariannaea sp. PMI_226]